MKKQEGIKASAFDKDQFQNYLTPNVQKCEKAKIVDFFVSTDSVVAKATVITDNTTRRIVVDWDDGDTDIINHQPGILSQIGDPNTVSPGTFEIYHRYDVFYDDTFTTEYSPLFRPADQKYVVALRVDDDDGGVDFKTQRITITPKYVVTDYPMFVWLEDSCDSFTDDFHDFHIIQTIDDEIIHEWDWKPSNAFFGKFQGILLQGSQFSKVYEIPPYFNTSFYDVRFEFTEGDLKWDDIVVIVHHVPLQHNSEIGEDYISESIEDSKTGDGCTIHFEYTRKIRLLAPLPADSSPVFESAH